MTDFCTRYPEDRDLSLAFLIKMLMGPKPKTLEEIHQSLRPRGMTIAAELRSD